MIRKPASSTEMTDKFFESCPIAWKPQHAQCIFDGVMSIESIDDVRSFAKYPI